MQLFLLANPHFYHAFRSYQDWIYYQSFSRLPYELPAAPKPPKPVPDGRQQELAAIQATKQAIWQAQRRESQQRVKPKYYRQKIEDKDYAPNPRVLLYNRDDCHYTCAHDAVYRSESQYQGWGQLLPKHH
jgi:hypothetical protein